jgi:hypothetical protein
MSFILSVVGVLVNVWLSFKASVSEKLGQQEQKNKDLSASLDEAENANKVSEKVDLESNDAVNADLSKWVRPEK